LGGKGLIIRAILTLYTFNTSQHLLLKITDTIIFPKFKYILNYSIFILILSHFYFSKYMLAAKKNYLSHNEVNNCKKNHKNASPLYEIRLHRQHW